MGPSRDGSDDALPHRLLDDATAEALIAGDTGPGTEDLGGVSAFLEEVRALGEGPPPPPSAALARMLAGEPEPGAGNVLRLVGDEGAPASPPAASNGHHGRAGAGSRRPSAGVVARAAVLALVATAGVTGAAAARLLPEPAQQAVSTAIETVTPFQVPGASSGDAGEAMARQGEPFTPGDGDGPLPPAGGPDGRSGDEPVDRPGVGEGADDQASLDPTMRGDPSGQRGPRPGPAVTGSRTTVAPGHGPPARVPATTGREGAGPGPAPPAGGRTYTATLTGSTGPGPPGDPGGAGRASVTVHLGRELLCVALTTSGIAPATSVHLHQASATSAQPIVSGRAPAGDGSPGCFGVAREVLARVRTDPAGHYLEVHNTEFPEGALRGFLSP